jgi:hypothetical protein
MSAAPQENEEISGRLPAKAAAVDNTAAKYTSISPSPLDWQELAGNAVGAKKR